MFDFTLTARRVMTQGETQHNQDAFMRTIATPSDTHTRTYSISQQLDDGK